MLLGAKPPPKAPVGAVSEHPPPQSSPAPSQPQHPPPPHLLAAEPKRRMRGGYASSWHTGRLLAQQQGVYYYTEWLRANPKPPSPKSQ